MIHTPDRGDVPLPGELPQAGDLGDPEHHSFIGRAELAVQRLRDPALAVLERVGLVMNGTSLH